MDAISCLNVVEFVRLDPRLDLPRQQIGDHADVIQWDHFALCKASRTPRLDRLSSSQNQERIRFNRHRHSFVQALTFTSFSTLLQLPSMSSGSLWKRLDYFWWFLTAVL